MNKLEQLQWFHQWKASVKALDLTTMAVLLQKGVDINTHLDDSSGTAFLHACKANHKQAINFLWHHTQKPNVNVYDADGVNPLIALCKIKKPACRTFKDVVDQTYDLNHQDKNGKTAFEYALKFALDSVKYKENPGWHPLQELLYKGAQIPNKYYVGPEQHLLLPVSSEIAEKIKLWISYRDTVQSKEKLDQSTPNLLKIGPSRRF